MEDEEGGGGHGTDERWLVSYADFITLLFALFVMLYALSLAGEAKKGQAFDSVAKAVGARPMMGGARPGLGSGVRTNPESLGERRGDKGLERARRAVESGLSKHPNSGVVLKLDERGLVITLSAARFFRSGNAAINPEQRPVLDLVLASIQDLPNFIRVEGFTDSVPISTSQFTDNWDLSAARAGNVLRYVLEHSSLPPERFSIAGYGPYHAVASNDTDEGRSLNRRVDIVILRTPEATSPVEASASQMPQAPAETAK